LLSSPGVVNLLPFAAAFEVIGLYRTFVSQDKVTAVQPMNSLISGAVHHQDKYGL
jgi:hypothetical protein